MSHPPEQTTDQIPPIMRATSVAVPLERAFELFTKEIGAWWPLPTHGLYADRAGGVEFRHGFLVEYAVDGAEEIWGSVRVWEPPNRLVISWHPGRDTSEASEVEVHFEPDGHGTRIILEHRGWEAFGRDVMARRHSYVGPNAWGFVLDHFSDLADPRPDAPDLAVLTTAYDEFFAEAESDVFGSPADGEWDADQVLAHVALNDAALLAVCQSIVHGRSAPFENLTSQDPEVLLRWIAATGSKAALIERGRQTARVLHSALSRLSLEQLSTHVHCRLAHDGEIVLNGPRPWRSLAIETQAAMHIPAHTAQLRDLRQGKVEACE
jgi:uncharacterized protein YndB with AHSA1/START domain